MQSALNDAELSSLEARISRQLARYHPATAVLDLTGMDVIDSFSIQQLQRLCKLLRLYAVRTMISGIQPEVAIVMSLRGFDLKGVDIAIDLTEAFTLLEKRPARTGREENIRHRAHPGHHHP